MGMRTFWVSLSVFLTLASAFGATVWPGPNYGTDFKGGTEVELAFKQKPMTRQRGARGGQQGRGLPAPRRGRGLGPAHPNRFLIRVQEVSSLDDDEQKQRSGRRSATAWRPRASRMTASRPAPRGEVKFSPGGDKISLRYDSEPDLEKIAEQVASVPAVEMRVAEKNPQIVSPRDHKVEVAAQVKGDLLVDGLREELGADVASPASLRVEWVGPKAGKQLREAAIKSVAIAIVFIMAYVAFRFDLRFAPGGILAFVHDSLVVIGVFVVLKREITLSTIAAILTIVGYSIADTVIVYDRIRENLGKHRNKSFAQIINISVSETLSRTVLTSGARCSRCSCSSSGARASSRTSRSRWSSASSPVRTRRSTSPRPSPSGSTARCRAETPKT